LLLIVGAGLVGLGLVALKFPVFLDSYDQWGWQIKCGTGYGAELEQAQIAAQVSQTNVVDQCQTALMARRAWSIPIAVVGWVILSGLAVALWRHAAPTGETADALT